MRSGNRDCYIIIPSDGIQGPYSVKQARDVLAVNPLSAVLIRAGFEPVHVEDGEGVEQVLHASPKRLSRLPLPPQRLEREIFGAGVEYSVSGSQEFAQAIRSYAGRRVQQRLHDRPRAVRSKGSQDPQEFPNISPTRRHWQAVVRRGGILLGVGLLILRPDAFDPEEMPGYGLPTLQGGLSLRARAPEGLSRLGRVVHAKLREDPEVNARELLDLLPHHRMFHDAFLPSPDLVAAHSVFHLSRAELTRSSIWRPLLRLLGDRPQRSLTALAFHAAEIGRLTGQSLQKSVKAERWFPVRAYRMRSDGAAFWPGPKLNFVTARFRADLANSVVRAIRATQSVGPFRDGEERVSAHVFRSQLLWWALMLVAGHDMQAEAAEVAALVTAQNTGLDYPDAQILTHVLGEMSEAPAFLLTAEKLGRRLRFLSRLHQENRFFCQPGRSSLGLELLAQTVRSASQIGFQLPGLEDIFAQCTPLASRMQSLREDRVDARKEESLVLMRPRPASARSFEMALLRLQRPAGLENSVQQWLTYLALLNPQGGSSFATLDYLREKCQRVPQAPLEDPICWRLAWEHIADQDLAERRTYLSLHAAAYGMPDTQELFLGWFVEAYLNPRTSARWENDLALQARALDMERYLDLDRPHLGSLEWYVKFGKPLRRPGRD